jgi:16S rRNA (uracil1498-N3)-methyltransferase
MPAERYYLDHALHAHQQQELKGSEFHHLAHVMRTRKGETVELVNGRGALAQATVQEIMKDKALLRIEQVTQEPDYPCRLILAQAMPKPNRLDFVLEKGTELGVDCFWLFPGELSTKKEFFSHQLERARTVTIAAMKQCGRLTLPQIILQPAIDQWTPWNGIAAFFGDLDPQALPFETAWRKLESPIYPVMFITGPEAGFSKQEKQLLRNQGAVGVKLHPHILRTDTASLMALSLLSHWFLGRV